MSTELKPFCDISYWKELLVLNGVPVGNRSLRLQGLRAEQGECGLGIGDREQVGVSCVQGLLGRDLLSVEACSPVTLNHEDLLLQLLLDAAKC